MKSSRVGDRLRLCQCCTDRLNFGQSWETLGNKLAAMTASNGGRQHCVSNGVFLRTALSLTVSVCGYFKDFLVFCGEFVPNKLPIFLRLRNHEGNFGLIDWGKSKKRRNQSTISLFTSSGYRFVNLLCRLCTHFIVVRFLRISRVCAI